MESIIELLENIEFALQVLFGKDESGNAEVVGTWLLSESAPWHQCNPSVLQDLQTVEQISGLVVGFCCLDGLLGEVNLRKGIHCSFHFIGGDILHASKRLSDCESSFL